MTTKYGVKTIWHCWCTETFGFVFDTALLLGLEKYPRVLETWEI